MIIDHIIDGALIALLVIVAIHLPYTDIKKKDL